MNRISSQLERDVFVDTSGYFAAAVNTDSNHRQALDILKQILSARRHLITTNFVLGETHTLLLNRLRYSADSKTVRARALAFVDQILAGTTTLIRVTAEDEARVLEIIRGYDDKSFSYFDATGFAAMERLGLSLAFTFDQDFVRHGYTALAATA